MSRVDLLLSVGFSVPAALLTLFADAMFWDAFLTLVVLGLWATAAVCWLVLALRYSLREKEVETPVLAVIAPVLLAVVLTVASTDWPTRAALAVSQDRLAALAASAPEGAQSVDVQAGVYRVTWISKNKDRTYLGTAGLISGDSDNPVLDFALSVVGLVAYVLSPDECGLILLDDAQAKELGAEKRPHHLSGDWYCDCNAATGS